MSEKNTGGPAFPFGDYEAGMTLRDYFAAKAMQGDAAAGDPWPPGVPESEIRKRAELYYQLADAMLKARES